MWNTEQLTRLSREERISLTELRKLIPATPTGLACLEEDIEAIDRIIHLHGQMMGELARDERRVESNGSFLDAQQELILLERKREGLKQRKEIVGIYSEQQDGQHVVWGSTFIIKYGKGGEESGLAALFGPLEREHSQDINPLTPVDLISCTAPLGLSLWRARPKVGKVVNYQVEGRAMKCQVLEIIQDHRAILKPPAALSAPTDRPLLEA